MLKEVIQSLWSLQELDNEIAYLNKKCAEIPKKIEGLKSTLQDFTNSLEKERTNLINFKKEYKLAEVDLKTCEEKITQYNIQLYSAKTNEQYKAFLKEIDAQKKLKAEIEEKMIDLLEKVEKSEVDIKRLEKEMELINEDTQKKIAELKEEEARTKEAIAVRELQRQKLTERLNQEYLNIYERIRVKKEGIAVVKVVDAKCSACFNPIPPQTIIEINKKEKLYYCDYCGRILVSVAS